jgi:uncharacterized protein (TIGR02996 family)
MKPIEAAFLDDICAHPADRAPRLIYADWLDEHRGTDPQATARARFIRLQCAVEALDPGDPRYLPGKAEANRLLAEHADHWTPDLPRTALSEFRGGFIEALTLPVKILLERLNKLRRRCPLRSLSLLDIGTSWPEFLRSPLPAQVEELDIAGRFRADWWDWPGESSTPASRWLEELASASFPCLRKLWMGGNVLWPGQLEAALAVERMPALESLDLLGCDLSFAGARALAHSDLPRRLHHIALSADPPNESEPALEELLSARWSELHGLTLADIQQRPGVLLTLARAPWLTRLATLRLAGATDLGPLLSSPLLEDRLEELEIQYGYIAGAEPDWWMSRPWFGSLRSLRLQGPLSENLIPALARTSHPPRLDRLAIERSPFFAEESARTLAVALEQTAPRTLVLLSCSGWSMELGLPQLVTAPCMACVQRLELRNAGVGANALRALLDSPYLDGLVALDLRDNKGITPTWRELLRERFPFAEF